MLDFVEVYVSYMFISFINLQLSSFVNTFFFVVFILCVIIVLASIISVLPRVKRVLNAYQTPRYKDTIHNEVISQILPLWYHKTLRSKVLQNDSDFGIFPCNLDETNPLQFPNSDTYFEGLDYNFKMIKSQFNNNIQSKNLTLVFLFEKSFHMVTLSSLIGVTSTFCTFARPCRLYSLVYNANYEKYQLNKFVTNKSISNNDIINYFNNNNECSLFVDDSFNNFLQNNDTSVLNLDMKDVSNQQQIKKFFRLSVSEETLKKWLITSKHNDLLGTVEHMYKLCSTTIDDLLSIIVVIGYYSLLGIPKLFNDNNKELPNDYYDKFNLTTADIIGLKNEYPNFTKGIINLLKGGNLEKQAQKVILKSFIPLCCLLQNDFQECVFASDANINLCLKRMELILSSVQGLVDYAMADEVQDYSRYLHLKIFVDIRKIIDNHSVLSVGQFLKILFNHKDVYHSISGFNIVSGVYDKMQDLHATFTSFNCNLFKMGSWLRKGNCKIYRTKLESNLYSLLSVDGYLNYIPEISDELRGKHSVIIINQQYNKAALYAQILQFLNNLPHEEFIQYSGCTVSVLLTNNFPLKEYFDLSCSYEDLHDNIMPFISPDVVATLMMFTLELVEERPYKVVQFGDIVNRRHLLNNGNHYDKFLTKLYPTQTHFIQLKRVHYTLDFTNIIHAKVSLMRDIVKENQLLDNESTKGALLLIIVGYLKDEHKLSDTDIVSSLKVEENSDDNSDYDTEMYVFNALTHKAALSDALLPEKHFKEFYGFYFPLRQHRFKAVRHYINRIKDLKINGGLVNGKSSRYKPRLSSSSPLRSSKQKDSAFSLSANTSSGTNFEDEGSTTLTDQDIELDQSTNVETTPDSNEIDDLSNQVENININNERQISDSLDVSNKQSKSSESPSIQPISITKAKKKFNDKKKIVLNKQEQKKVSDILYNTIASCKKSRTNGNKCLEKILNSLSTWEDTHLVFSLLESDFPQCRKQGVKKSKSKSKKKVRNDKLSSDESSYDSSQSE